MKYLEFKKQMGKFITFNLGDIRKIEPGFDLRRLSEWQAKKQIIRLRRGHYIFADQELDERTLFIISNSLYQPSYVSLETALSYHGLIPEGVFTVTCVSSRKTQSFRTSAGDFSYRSIKPELMFGYQLEQYRGRAYKMAEMEKSVLDYIYFHPKISRYEDFYEWRFNSEDFLKSADMAKLSRYAAAFENKRLLLSLEKLIHYMKQSE